MARPPMKPLETDMSKSVVPRLSDGSVADRYAQIRDLDIKKGIWWGVSRRFRRALTET